jgi:hypothetical protein
VRPHLLKTIRSLLSARNQATGGHYNFQAKETHDRAPLRTLRSLQRKIVRALPTSALKTTMPDNLLQLVCAACEYSPSRTQTLMVDNNLIFRLKGHQQLMVGAVVATACFASWEKNLDRIDAGASNEGNAFMQLKHLQNSLRDSGVFDVAMSIITAHTGNETSSAEQSMLYAFRITAGTAIRRSKIKSMLYNGNVFHHALTLVGNINAALKVSYYRDALENLKLSSYGYSQVGKMQTRVVPVAIQMMGTLLTKKNEHAGKLKHEHKELLEWVTHFVLEGLEDAHQASEQARDLLISAGYHRQWIKDASKASTKWQKGYATLTTEEEKTQYIEEKNGLTSDHFELFNKIQLLVDTDQNDPAIIKSIEAGAIHTMLDQLMLGDHTMWALIQNVTFYSRHLTHPQIIQHPGAIKYIASAIKSFATLHFDQFPKWMEACLETSSNLALRPGSRKYLIEAGVLEPLQFLLCLTNQEVADPVPESPTSSPLANQQHHQHHRLRTKSKAERLKRQKSMKLLRLSCLKNLAFLLGRRAGELRLTDKHFRTLIHEYKILSRPTWIRFLSRR